MYIWDLPTRLFHWLLAIFTIIALVSGKLGQMEIHQRAGLAVLSLLVFRFLWGFIGGYYSLFKNFIPLIVKIKLYFNDIYHTGLKYSPGHSPLGSIAVVLLLGIIFFQAVFGLFSSDDVFFDGPLALLFPNVTETATSIHRLLSYLVITIVIIHFLAIILYKVKGIHLTKTMLTGKNEFIKLKRISKDNHSYIKSIFGILAMMVLIILGQLIPIINQLSF